MGMALAFFVVISTLEFFGVAQKLFFRLKEKEECTQGAFAALDKMKIDLVRAGQGLVVPIALGLIEAVVPAERGLLITREVRSYSLAADVEAGAVRIPLTKTSGLSAGRALCIWDERNGEVRDIASVEPDSPAVVLASPLDSGYSRDRARMSLLESTSLYWDPAQTLRRRVNLSSGQPLLENVSAADFLYDRAANLATIRLEIQSEGDRSYEISVFPKNTGAAAGQRQ